MSTLKVQLLDVHPVSWAVAVIVVVPSAIAVTIPSEFIVATDGSELVQITFLFVAFSGEITAVS